MPVRYLLFVAKDRVKSTRCSNKKARRHCLAPQSPCAGVRRRHPSGGAHTLPSMDEPASFAMQHVVQWFGPHVAEQGALCKHEKIGLLQSALARVSMVDPIAQILPA